MSNKTLFVVDIGDGHSFKNIIAMIKNENDEIVTFIVSKNKMSLSYMSKNQSAIHDIQFDPDELNNYQYNIRDYDQFPIVMNTNELVGSIKSIGKKDSLKMSWTEGHDKIGVQVIKSGKDSDRNPILFVNIIRRETSQLSLNNLNDDIGLPIKIPCKEFSEMCVTAITLKCLYVELIGCNTHVTFKGILSDGTVGVITKKYLSNKVNVNDEVIEKITSFNDDIAKFEVKVIKREELIKVKIPINTIKTLTKTQNITAPGSLLKVYICPDKMIKLECKIATYGTYKIYLRDSKTN